MRGRQIHGVVAVALRLTPASRLVPDVAFLSYFGTGVGQLFKVRNPR